MVSFLPGFFFGGGGACVCVNIQVCSGKQGSFLCISEQRSLKVCVQHVVCQEDQAVP